ncbi:D-alanyl-D-alanine carboxypeptidase family protein [Desulfolithobacter sp.]
MNRFRLLFLFFSITCLLFSLAHHPASHAAQIPVLTATAKQKPAATVRSAGKAASATSSQIITLGRRGNIKTVKTRPGRTSGNYLPSIRKKISARSAIVIDARTGDTIFAKNADRPRQPASTIKILTGMIALKSLKERDPIKVSQRASRMPRSKIYLDPRKTYQASDLIDAVLLASANDASVALAENIAGSEKEFAEMMTLRARLWGAKNTVCRTATGLTARGQQSTARDLAQLFRHVMQDKEFAQRINRVKVRTSFGQVLRNHNKALWQIEGAVGGKTGYTNAARQTYVGMFTRGSDSIVVAIMGSETMWDDLKRLVEYGFKRKQQIQLVRAETEKKQKKETTLN